MLTFRTFPLKIEIILCLKVFIPGIFSVSTQATCHENIRKIKILYFLIFIWKSLIIRALKNGSTWNDSRSKMMMSNRPLFDHKLAKLSLSNSRMIVHFTQYCTLPPCIINSEKNHSKIFDFRCIGTLKSSFSWNKKSLIWKWILHWWTQWRKDKMVYSFTWTILTSSVQVYFIISHFLAEVFHHQTSELIELPENDRFLRSIWPK